MKFKVYNIIGIIGAISCLVLFALYPNWPTPDKLLVFLTFVFMSFGQGWQLFKRLAPFVILLFVYQSFRGLAPILNSHVDYTFLPKADKFLFFGHLPTATLQNILWHGSIKFYDFIFYGAYMLHFVLPIGLALLIWKYKEKYYWQFITSFLVLSFMGFLGYLAFPAAPPWMASDMHIIEPIHRVSSDVWWAFGIKDFPSLYNKISPNAVAAMPSLHAAYATLLFISVYKIFGKKWSLLALIYPFLIFLGTVYMGEHYVIDVLAGILFAVLAYLISPFVLKFTKKQYFKIKTIILKTKIYKRLAKSTPK